MIFKMVITV